MTAISSLTSLTLDLPPSCIQFSPRHPQLFVVGTYYLHGKEQQGDLSTDITAQPSPDASGDNDEDPLDDNTTERTTALSRAQKRTGSLIVCKLEDDQITRLSSTATDFAILDIQWVIRSDVLGDLLAVATSAGLLAFYQLWIAARTAELVLVSVYAITEPEILVLSLAWHPTRAHILGVTLSDGSVQLCESTQVEPWSPNAVLRTTEIHRHELEAWTLAFTSGEVGEVTNVLSGGDDIAMQCSHINDTHAQEPALLWRDRKLHEAGVTAILPLSETLIVTGSYDDYIRLLSTPTVGRRQVLAELNLGGGVWRLKVLQAGVDEGVVEGDPTQASSSSNSALPSVPVSAPTSIVLLCSCMHAGTRIVKLIRSSSGNWAFEVLAKFEEHRSMNYGSDVQPCQSQGAKGKVIVSTSFYDKLMCLWRVELNALWVDG